jgi:hypothetical protein
MSLLILFGGASSAAVAGPVNVRYYAEMSQVTGYYADMSQVTGYYAEMS